jgi:HEPN domain-containing protein
MRDDAHEWVEKAEGDFNAGLREVRARKAPNYDDACFHAQQCIEKYLKARLIEAGVAFPRTHDLEELHDLILPYAPLWEAFRSRVLDLTSYAVAFRYPGESATRDMAKRAVADCRTVRKAIRGSLGLGD